MNVVIVGGGYAGAACALRLAARVRKLRLRASVTLVNPSPEFTERIRLHQAASGQRLARRSLAALLTKAGVRFVRATATAIDRDARIVRTDHRPLAWDRLVLAAGSSIAVPAELELEEPPLALNAGDIERIAARLAALPDGGHVAVVGAGLTGVETAAEIAERYPRLNVTLASRGEPLASWSAGAAAYVREHFRRHSIEVLSGADVTAVRRGRVQTAAGAFRADVCLWAAGFAASSLGARAGLAVDAVGRARMDAMLRAIDDARVYAIGDAATPGVDAGRQVPMGCKSAEPTGAHAADNIVAELLDRPLQPLDFATPFYCVSLGRRAGLIQLPGAAGTQTGGIITRRLGAWIKEAVSAGTWWALLLERRGVRAVQWPRTGRVRSERGEPARPRDGLAAPSDPPRR